jgi:hypothetical protein
MAGSTATSYTAPQLSEEEMKEEIANLADEERADIQHDRTGKQAIKRESVEMLLTKRAEVQQALDTIASGKKQAYLHAMDACGYLFTTESEPLLFFRCEDYNSGVSLRKDTSNQH